MWRSLLTGRPCLWCRGVRLFRMTPVFMCPGISKLSQTYEILARLVRGTLTSSGLKSRILRGGAWLASGSFAEQAARFARNLILVRILAPSAFGTMALVLSINSMLQAITEIGAREALIQNPRGTEPRYINMTWWMSFGRSAGTYVMLFIIAPVLARFYGNPNLTSLLRVALVALVLEGAMSAKAYITLKQLTFSRWAFISHGGAICGITLTVILSLSIHSVWALVIGSVSESAARFILSYVLCPFVPSLHWDKVVLKELLKFSKGLVGLPILNLIYSRADVFVLAKILSPTDLGLYTMAVYLILVPAGFIIGLMGQLLVPVFSKIQQDVSHINRILVRSFELVLVAGVPVLPFFYFCAKPLLHLVYGNPYGVEAGAMSVAVGVAMINIVNGQITGVFFACGRPELHRRGVAAMALCMVALIYPLARLLGPIGGQVSSLIAATAGFVLQADRVRYVTGFQFVRMKGILALSACCAMAVALTCVLGRVIAPSPGPITEITVGTAGCVIAYIIALLLVVSRQKPSPAACELPPLRRSTLAETLDA